MTAAVCACCGTPLRQLLGRGAVVRARYRVDALCGSGGFGAVYRATDLATGQTVALKENLAHRTVARFEREARLLMALDHPHLPKVHAVFTDEDTGRAYLVMDFVPGESLESWVAHRGCLTWQEAQAVFGQIVAAVAYLHQQGVIHRDIKPSNILLRRYWAQASVDDWEEVILPPPGLTETAIAKLTDRARFQRGWAYWQDGWRLQKLKRHGWTLGGVCLGGDSPGGPEYQVWVILGDGGVVARFCDCPDFRRERFCKHLVALLLAWVYEPHKFEVVAEKMGHRLAHRLLPHLTPQWHAMLVDFGVAKALEPINPARPHSSSLVAWTDGFSPPEQYQSGAAVDARADQYALAATLLFALTGRLPPDALTRMARRRQGKPDLPAKPLGVPEPVWQALRVALHLDPAQRFDNVLAFWDAAQDGIRAASPAHQKAAQCWLTEWANKLRRWAHALGFNLHR